MRIISGKYRGLQIEAPKGLDVRPSTDRVREAMFSSLISLKTLNNKIVLDAFAGSGAFAFECISRGAKFALMFEKNKKTCKTIQENMNQLKACDSVKLVVGDIYNYNFNKLDDSFVANVIFLDPPYKMCAKKILELLEMLKNNDRLEKSSIIIYEHSKADDFNIVEESFKDKGFVLLKSKVYGNTACEYLEFS